VRHGIRRGVAWGFPVILLAPMVAHVFLAWTPASVAAELPDGLCREAVRFCQSGDTARAETLLVTRLSERPTDPCALTNLGNLARLRGELSQAKVLYRMALRTDSADAGILLNYAAVLHALNDASADSTYRLALRLSRNATEVLDKLSIPRRDPAADSLVKGADIEGLIGGAGPGGRPVPDPNLVELIRRTYAVERQRTAGVEETPGTRTPKPEIERANGAILASLPLYWKQ